MENPKCPYCGGEMVITNRSTRNMDGSLRFFYACIKCDSESPKVFDDAKAAYAAAMKRDGAKGKAEGKWIWDTHEGWECRCSRCGEPLPILTDSNDEFICKVNYCPNCGAEIKEIIDE